jgi:hypothetical protein
MPISNKKYPASIRVIKIFKERGYVNRPELKYAPIKPSIICPAPMLAASRTDKVIGRRKILIVSIKISGGLKISGDPVGSK